MLFHRVSFSVADDGAEVEVVRHFTESICYFPFARELSNDLTNSRAMYFLAVPHFLA